MSERKHFYLITEHEEQDRVGCVSVFESRMSQPLKNEEGPITVLDDDKEGFRDVGKKVGLGYADFPDEETYEEQAAEVMQDKIREVDEQWAEKAGVHELVYGES